MELNHPPTSGYDFAVTRRRRTSTTLLRPLTPSARRVRRSIATMPLRCSDDRNAHQDPNDVAPWLGAGVPEASPSPRVKPDSANPAEAGLHDAGEAGLRQSG